MWARAVEALLEAGASIEAAGESNHTAVTFRFAMFENDDVIESFKEAKQRGR